MRGVSLELVFFSGKGGNSPNGRDDLVRDTTGLGVEVRACTRGLGDYGDEQEGRQCNERETCIWRAAAVVGRRKTLLFAHHAGFEREFTAQSREA